MEDNLILEGLLSMVTELKEKQGNSTTVIIQTTTVLFSD